MEEEVVNELTQEKDMRRGIVNNELMMLYGYDVSGYLPPLPHQEKSKTSLANAWECPNQAMRQLSNTLRRGPRSTIGVPRLSRESVIRDNGRPHSSYDNHVKAILNTQLPGKRPATSSDILGSRSYCLPHHKLGPVKNEEGLIQPKKLSVKREQWEEDSLHLRGLLSASSGLRRPKLSGSGCRKKSARTEKAGKKLGQKRKHTVEDLMRVVKGDMTDLPPDIPTQVKIYLCSGPTDMESEKRYLAEHAYPELRHFAQQNGLDLRIIDASQCTDIEDQKNLNYKLDLLQECQEQSIGPFFVLLLGDRYGPAMLPITLAKKDHNALCKVADEHLLENQYLLHEYYKYDANDTQQTMRLQVDCLDDLVCFHMRKLMKEAVRLAVQTSRVDESLADIIKMSASECEVKKALGNESEEAAKCLCFHRQFLGLRDNFTDDKASTYMDLVPVYDNRGILIDSSSWSQHEALIDYIQKRMQADFVKQYHVSWLGSGIQEDNDEHLQYLRDLKNDFIDGVEKIVKHNLVLWEMNHPHFPLYREILQHVKTCKAHLQNFVGRTSELQAVTEYFMSEMGSYPLYIIGEQAVGKSAFVSMVAEHSKRMLGDNVVTLVRFLGSSHRTQRLLPLLQDLCAQLCSIFQLDTLGTDEEASVNKVTGFLISLFDKISRHHKKPLLIILDGLEELSEDDRSRSLFWLPKLCPSNIHLVVSMGSTDRSLIRTVKSRIRSAHQFLVLNRLAPEDAKKMVSKTLEEMNRALNAVQQNSVETVVQENSELLFVQCLINEARQWWSYTDVDTAHLPADFEDCLTKMLYGLEDMFGENFVRETVFYLSLFRHGISEVELRDALSLLQTVHFDLMEGPNNSFVQRQTDYSSTLDNSLTALLNKLKPVLTGADMHGRLLLRWKHGAYYELIKDMYFGPDEFAYKVTEAYNGFVELFIEQGPIIKTFGDNMADNCAVMPQHLIKSNLRKLYMLPEAIVKVGSTKERVRTFKANIACNFEFLMVKIEATSADDLRRCFDLCTIRDLEIDLMKNILQISLPGLRKSAKELPLQILGMVPWISEKDFASVNQVITEAQTWVENCTEPVIIPMLQCLPDVTNICTAEYWNLMEILTVITEHKMGVVRNKDGSIEIWDLRNEEIAFQTDLTYDIVIQNVFCSNTKILGINAPHNIQVWEILSGEKLMEVDLKGLFDATLNSMFFMCCSSGFEQVVLCLSDEDFNQSVVLIDLSKESVKLNINSFDVKDEFFANSATLLQKESILVFVNARSEIVNENNMETSDFIKLNTYCLRTGKLLNCINCGTKTFNKLLRKDDKTVLISWQDCSFDAFDVVEGLHQWCYNAPETNLHVKSSVLTDDGYLVALGHTRLDSTSNQPHFGLWFWNLHDQVAGELVLQPLTHPKEIPSHFLILEDLHIAVMGVPDQAKLSVWDLPTSSMIYSLQAHSLSLDGLLKAGDPYQIYTFSHADKVVKLLDLYPVVEKSQRDMPNSQRFTKHDDSLEFGSVESMDGIKKSRVSTPNDKSKRPKSVRFEDEVLKDKQLHADETLRRESVNEPIDLSELPVQDTDVQAIFPSRDKAAMESQAQAMSRVTHTIFTSDSRFLVSGHENCSPVIWDICSGTVVKTMTPHSAAKDLATPWVGLACKDKLIVGLTKLKDLKKEGWPEVFEYQVWTIATAEPFHPVAEEESFQCVTGNVSKDGEKAVLVTLTYYDPEQNSKSELCVVILDISGHSVLRRLEFLSPLTPSELQLSDDAQYAVALSPKKSLAETKDMMVLCLEVEEGKQPEYKTYEYKKGKKHRKYGATDNCLMHNALSLASGLSGDIQMWDITNGQYEGNLYHDPSEKDTRNPSLHNHGGKRIRHMVVSKDRLYLVCGAVDGVASVWDLDNEVLLFTYRAHNNEICQVAISDDNQYVVTSGLDMTLCVWQFGVVDKPLCQLYVHLAPSSLLISADNSTLVAVGAPHNKHNRLLMFRLKNLKKGAPNNKK